MAEQERTRTCAACRAEAPSTETEYTLIGSKHAWRCKKKLVAVDGQSKLDWFCPSCWKNGRHELRR